MSKADGLLLISKQTKKQQRLTVWKAAERAVVEWAAVPVEAAAAAAVAEVGVAEVLSGGAVVPACPS